MEDERTAKVRRLHLLIVDLRELILKLPSQMLESVATRSEFESVKRRAMDRLDSISATLAPDADFLGVVHEFRELLHSAKWAVGSVPYPEAIPFSSDAMRTEMFGVAGRIWSSCLSDGFSKDSVAEVLEEELDHRLTSIVTSYSSWWRLARERLSDGSVKLTDGLLRAGYQREGHRAMPGPGGYGV